MFLTGSRTFRLPNWEIFMEWFGPLTSTNAWSRGAFEGAMLAMFVYFAQTENKYAWLAVMIAEPIADWLADLILWMVHSGMRKGEMLALLWSDVQVLPNGRTIVEIQTSKSGEGRAVVCTSTMNEILEHQKKRKKENDERVFPIVKMTLRRKWEAARKAAGLQDVTIHDLRRTHSTHAAVAGVDLRTLAGRLGHANLSMLEKHYAALVGSASEEAAIKIEQAFARKG